MDPVPGDGAAGRAANGVLDDEAERDGGGALGGSIIAWTRDDRVATEVVS